MALTEEEKRLRKKEADRRYYQNRKLNDPEWWEKEKLRKQELNKKRNEKKRQERIARGIPERAKFNTEEERLEARRANQRRYNNSDKGKSKLKKWLSDPDNYEKSLEHSRNSKKRNPESRVSIEQRRRERKALVNESKLTKQDIIDLKNKFDNKCFNCGSDKKLNVDHFFPLSMGHALTENNRIILCLSCNCSKNNKNPHDFFSEKQLKELKTVYNININILQEVS